MWGILITLMGAVGALANPGFRPGTLEQIEEIRQTPARFSDPYEATFAGFTVHYRDFLSLETAHTHIQHVHTAYYWEPVPVKVVRQRIGDRVAYRRMVVILPGLQSRIGSPIFRRLIHAYAALNYHVIYIPSPWSIDLLSRGPNFLPGHPELEARVFHRIIRGTLSTFRPEWIESVEVVGASYGAFIAPIVQWVDHESSRPIFSRGATLLSPPASMNFVTATIDRMIRETEEQRGCELATRNLEFLLTYMFSNHQNGLANVGRRCVRYVIAQVGYRQGIASMIEAVAASSPFLIANVGREELEEMTFNKYASLAGLTPMGEQGELSFWLDRLNTADIPFRIFTTDDDFLLAPGNALRLARRYPQHVARFHWGGHTGYLAWPEFEALFEDEYSYPTGDNLPVRQNQGPLREGLNDVFIDRLNRSMDSF